MTLSKSHSFRYSVEVKPEHGMIYAPSSEDGLKIVSVSRISEEDALANLRHAVYLLQQELERTAPFE